MFNLQGGEIIIVILLALVVLGPEKLPDAMRKLGKMYGELRKVSSGFQDEFRKAVDEPMREVRDTANLLRDSVDLTKLSSGERDEKPKSAEMAPAPQAPAPFSASQASSAAAPIPSVTPSEPVDDAAEAAPEPVPEAASDPADSGDTDPREPGE